MAISSVRCSPDAPAASAMHSAALFRAVVPFFTNYRPRFGHRLMATAAPIPNGKVALAPLPCCVGHHKKVAVPAICLDGAVGC